MTTRIGQQLGNYRLVQLLGRGGFAEVYLGEHIHLGTQAAIKILLLAQLTQRDLDDFLVEAQRIARLNHRNIVRTLDFGIDPTENVPYLIMDYAIHGTLRQLHPDGSIVPLITVVSYVKQIAAALQHTHNHRLVHRDVKPQNMLMGSNGEVLLSDFGIAVLAHSPSSMTPQNTSGTIHYMAPEHIRGQARPASDQYSLGIVVYEWLSGTRPFNGSHFVDIAMQHLMDAPPPLREKNPMVSSKVEQAVMRALEKNPEKRYASVQDFAQELELAYQAEQRIVSPSAVKVQPPGTLLYTYQVPQGTVHAFSWTPKGHRVAVGDAVGKVEVWDVATGTRICANDSHTTEVETIVWSPDGDSIASFTHKEGKAQLWNARTGKGFATYDMNLNPNSSSFYEKMTKPIAWSPDSSRIALISINSEGFTDLLIRSIRSRSSFHASPYQATSMFFAVAWSPDGSYLASLGFGQPEPHERYRRIVQIHDGVDGSTVAVCWLRQPPPAGSRWRITAANITWSPSSGYISSHASFSYDGRRRLYSYNIEGGEQELSEEEREYEARFAPQQLDVWDAPTGQEVVSIPDVQALAWSPDSMRIAFVTHRKTIDIWDTVLKQVIRTYSNHTQAVAALSWSPNNSHIASASIDGTVEVWRPDTGNTILTCKSPASNVVEVLWSPDGNSVAARGNDNSVFVWQVM